MAFPKITHKQFTILTYLYQFHFIDRVQMQSLLEHKNHRRIQAWLNDLLIKRCVGRIYSKKMPDNTKPAIYYLAKYGRKILQQAQEEENKKAGGDGDDSNQFVADAGLIFTEHGLKGSYRDGSRTPLYRLQCLAMVDIYLAARYYMRQINNRFSYYSRFENADYDFLAELKPDGFVTQTAKNGHQKDYALFFITHRMPRKVIRFKLRHLINFLNEESWEKDSLPKIRIICSNPPIRSYAKKIIESKLDFYGYPEDINCRFITLNQFAEHGFEDKFWVKPKNNDDY